MPARIDLGADRTQAAGVFSLAVSTESKRLRREATRLLAQLEQQGLAIVARYQEGADLPRGGPAGRYRDFRRFIEKVDHFHVFVDLVEERLPQFEDAKRDALAKHLAEIRWRIIIVEVDTTQIFLVRIVESNQPWPLGSRQFLERRLNRLGEFAEFYDRFGERYHLPPLKQALVNAVTGLLQAQIRMAPALEDFTEAYAAFRPAAFDADGEPQRIADRRPVALLPLAPKAAKAPAPKFRVRELAGRFYVERDSIVAVSEACRSAKMSMDQLAQKLGVSRPALVLMLNGNDPIQRNQMEELRAFIGAPVQTA